VHAHSYFEFRSFGCCIAAVSIHPHLSACLPAVGHAADSPFFTRRIFLDLETYRDVRDAERQLRAGFFDFFKTFPIRFPLDERASLYDIRSVSVRVAIRFPLSGFSLSKD